MIRRILGAFILVGFVGSVSAEVNTGIGHDVHKDAKPAAPAGHDMYRPPAGPTAQGEVLEAISGAGYTYLHLKAEGKDFWIAGTQLEVKKGDVVNYDSNIVMHDFFSKTLNRKFDEITFASHVKLAK